MVEVRQCNSCRAPIVWTRMLRTGRPNPLDAEPTEDGMIRLMEDEGQAVHLSAEDAKRARENGEQLYTSHFGTCPDREEWIRKGHEKARQREQRQAQEPEATA